MKILHINFTDKGGGAAIAAYRHHEALRRAGIDSHMLVLVKKTDDPYVHVHKISSLSMFIKRVLGRIFILRPFYATWSWNHFGFDLSENPEVKSADIIILHWISSYTMSIKSIEKILKTGKTVYWFMHDMWAITGGCHYSLECNKYKTHCEHCEMARNRKGSYIEKDLSYYQFNEKRRRLTPYKNLQFITPSRWLAERVKESTLFGNHRVSVIPNVLDTNVFKPENKQNARKNLGLPLYKKLILFGADNLTNPYKGWDLLRDALSDDIENAEAVVYGVVPSDLQSQLSLKLHCMGHISDIQRLVDLYNACDIFVTPSIADNYPNVLIEAMSCGLPCVGTNVGGIPEIITFPPGCVTSKNNPKELREILVNALNNTFGKDTFCIREEIIKRNNYNNGLLALFSSK